MTLNYIFVQLYKDVLDLRKGQTIWMGCEHFPVQSTMGRRQEFFLRLGVIDDPKQGDIPRSIRISGTETVSEVKEKWRREEQLAGGNRSLVCLLLGEEILRDNRSLASYGVYSTRTSTLCLIFRRIWFASFILGSVQRKNSDFPASCHSTTLSAAQFMVFWPPFFFLVFFLSYSDRLIQIEFSCDMGYFLPFLAGFMMWFMILFRTFSL